MEKKIAGLDKKLDALILHIYYKLSEKIKKIFADSSEDFNEFDICVLG